MKLCVLLLTLLAVTFADELSDCKCQDGFIAQKNDNDEVMCYGIILKSIMPCNMPKKPRCRCGPEVTGIVQDAFGTWCSTYKRGKQVRRWPCENEDEWRTFYSQYSSERPSVKKLES